MRHWKNHDDGRVWFGMYVARVAMLLSLAGSVVLVGGAGAAIIVAALVIPHSLLCAAHHRRTGKAHTWLLLDQPLAAICVVVSPQAAIASIICMVVTGGDALGLDVKRVRIAAAIGSAVLCFAAVRHGDATLGVFVLAEFGAAVATANLVSYLKHKRVATSDRLESLLDGLHAYVHESDLETGEILYCNQHIIDRIGVITSVRDMTHHLHPDDVAPMLRSLARGVTTMAPVTLEMRVILGDDVFHMEQRTTFAEYRGRVRARSVMFDISSRKRIELEMEHRAFHDPLTDLPNRSLFHDRLTHAIERSHRTPTEHAVLLLDLDSFKDVNDGMGHQVGDDYSRRLRFA